MEDIIRLDVGGTPYTTSRDTLCRYPDSMFARMFSGELPNVICTVSGCQAQTGPLKKTKMHLDDRTKT